MPRRLLLLGAGPTHAQVLAAFAREPLVGAELALLSPDPHLVHAARVPAFVAGRLPAAACRHDTAALATAAGATWVRGRVAAVDAASRRVTLTDGAELEADLVSVDEPAVADFAALEGAREHALVLHPAERFVALFDGLVELAARKPVDVVVVGFGAAAVETTLALAQRLAPRGDERARIALVAGADGPLPGWPVAAVAEVQRLLARARITVFREPCVALRADAAVLASGARLACDAALLALPPRPAAWLATSGLALTDDGQPVVTPGLQSASHPDWFAPGAAAEAASAALTLQLRRAAAAGPLLPVKTRPPALRWLRCGQGRALAVWRRHVLAGRAMGAWRDRLDRLSFERADVAPGAARADAAAGAAATRSAGS
jgi:NADH dehydrogenase FAD-containing subunit